MIGKKDKGCSEQFKIIFDYDMGISNKISLTKI